jgi:hypothetical protein
MADANCSFVKRRAPRRSALTRVVPCMLAPNKFASRSDAERREASCKFAPLKFAPFNRVSRSCDSRRFAPLKSAPQAVALIKSTSSRFESSNRAPSRKALRKLAPFKLTAVKSRCCSSVSNSYERAPKTSKIAYTSELGCDELIFAVLFLTNAQRTCIIGQWSRGESCAIRARA